MCSSDLPVRVVRGVLPFICFGKKPLSQRNRPVKPERNNFRSTMEVAKVNESGNSLVEQSLNVTSASKSVATVQSTQSVQSKSVIESSTSIKSVSSSSTRSHESTEYEETVEYSD